MKRINTNSLFATFTVFATTLVLTGCEMGDFDADGDGTPDSEQTSEPPEETKFYAVEIVDDKNNPTLAPSCDKGSIKSPGADIINNILVIFKKKTVTAARLCRVIFFFHFARLIVPLIYLP